MTLLVLIMIQQTRQANEDLKCLKEQAAFCTPAIRSPDPKVLS